MKRIPVIAILDIGKTNKKLLLFDEAYKLVYEESVQLEETIDEDGFPCEDVNALTKFINDSFDSLWKDERYEVKAANVAAYGASFVYLDGSRQLILPLYNYMKPISPSIQKKFYDSYGGEENFAMITASPVLGNLNSGMQLYRLKYEKPEFFSKIKYALHLPQYISFVLAGNINSELTSIGCHTNLWNFKTNRYHIWVEKEGIQEKLAPLVNSDAIPRRASWAIQSGIGLHDSSAALIPYLISFREPFILISTGSWCITLNPFNNQPLTDDELKQDCLCYLSHEGKPVKASRLFAGNEHETEVKRLSEHFGKPFDYYKNVEFDAEIIKRIHSVTNEFMQDLNLFSNYEEAYHQLMSNIIAQQVISTNLVLRGTNCKRIFVDGGFSDNSIYMNLLSLAFPNMEVFGATVPQASALGAALIMHRHWNYNDFSSELVELKSYPTQKETTISKSS
jgi:sugar (pentulose or hexulose) kinase